jgi:hypothetical protein
VGGDGLDLTDGGANSSVTLSVDVTDILGNGLTETSNNIVLGTPSTLTVSTANGVTASSHTHAITTSSDVTVASILASDSNGRLGLEGLGIGVVANGDYIRVASGATAIGLENSSAGRLEFTNAATDTLELHDADFLVNDGTLYIGDTSDAEVTTGIVVNQGSATDAIATFKNTAMVHDITDFAEADTFWQIEMFNSLEGGLRQWGFSEGEVAINLRAGVMSGTAVKSAAATAPIMLQAEISDGAGSTETLATGGATRNAVAVRDRGNTLAIFGVDGDLCLDTVVNENNWDAHDDIALLHGFRAGLMPEGHELRQRFGQFIEGAREVLERTGVVTYNDDGHHFVATKALQMLTIDAMRQVYERFDDRLNKLEASNGIA